MEAEQFVAYKYKPSYVRTNKLYDPGKVRKEEERRGDKDLL